ncbi:MAG: tRNA pseudouridine(38-40) synthase TruA [Clostridiales Family XIII bacterium]|jgi:tRNA pseudouridine38-40 synthase|nr:tRNA pseudouridine(38-40) synthase TruA [Clostridiales Family XIII bacterium]
MTRNVLITVEYDGSAFHGWQAQPGVRTVQSALEEALARVSGEDVRLNGASRTDAGVHARGQAASFTGDFGIPACRVPVAANNLLEGVRVLAAIDVPEGFHARFDALGKTYVYRVAASREPDIFLRNYRYFLNESPDKSKMEAAAECLVGTHDFAAFRTTGGAGSAGSVRTITGIDIAQHDGTDTQSGAIVETEIRVTGGGFMYNMVRIIVGTLVEVGLGVREPGSVAVALESLTRASAGHIAPAGGLYLERVYYEHGRMDSSMPGQS